MASQAAKQLGFRVLVLGDVVREETQHRGLEPTPANVGAVMLQLREKEGPAAVATRLLPKIQETQSSQVVVEGIRSLGEIDELKTKFDVITIVIHASPRTRFQRLLSRGRSDDPKTPEVFGERDNRELGVGLGPVIALADYVAVNEGSIEELQANVKDILSKLNS